MPTNTLFDAAQKRPVSRVGDPRALSMMLESPSIHGPLRQVATIDHQGSVIAFARSDSDSTVFYNVLDLKVNTEVDNLEWTGFVKLDRPDQLRPAGSGIVTVDDVNGAILAVAETPMTAVSDEKYVYLFQQSSRGTVLLNRFMFKRTIPAGGGASIPVLEPVWEVRFQRSGKEDVPDGPRDTQGYTAPDGTPFIEPTIELPMVADLADGRFDVAILPDQSGTGARWQFVAANTTTGKLDLFSFPADEGGLPDLADVELDEHGQVEPDAAISLTLDHEGGQIPLEIAGKPSATLYTLRERVKATSGSDLLLKRTARLMIVQPVRVSGGSLQLATIDLAVSKQGTLAELPATVAASLVQPANDALQFADAAYLQLPSSPLLALKGSYRAEFWLYPDSLVAGDQYILRGDTADPATEAAVYVMLTRDLKIQTGFGSGTAAIAASTTSPVVTPGQWVHLQVAFDSHAASGNFTITVNGHAVPVTGADNTATPSGRPITSVSGSRDGIVGILDGLQLWDASSGSATMVADWPFDEVDYNSNPPTTPDRGPNHLDASVHGAVLVSSTAPISSDTAGTLYLDNDGLSSYVGVLAFAQPGDSATLFTGSDGLVHLYYAGQPDGEQDGLFCVAQYDAESARAVWQAGWTATTASSTQTGTVQLTAARSGTYMNLATIAVQPADAAELCTVAIDDGHGRTETWRGIPRELGRFVATINGSTTDDLFSPAFRAGAATFYDCAGQYAQSRLKVSAGDAEAVLSLLSRFPSVMQLASAGVDDVTATAATVRLTYTVPQWTGATTITQSWPNVSPIASSFLQQLGGTAPNYDYSSTSSADAAVYGLATLDAANTRHDMLILARSGVTGLSIAVEAGSRADRCTVRLSLESGGPQQATLTDVLRDQVTVAAAINASAVAPYLLAVTDGLSAAVLDQPATAPALRDLRAWAFLIAAFAEEPLAVNATVPAQSPVPAAILQGAQLTVDGHSSVLSTGSTMVRAVAGSDPSNGAPALVADSNGPTNLTTAAVNGGWIRVSPHKAIAVDGSNAVVWDMQGITSETLAIPGDVTVETWCHPAAQVSADARPRLAGYHRIGSPDFPDEKIQWALGLQPTPSLFFTDSTAINGSYDLDGTDCTLQLWVSPTGNGDSGRLLQLGTVGVSQPYLTLSVNDDSKVVANYASGVMSVTSGASLAKGVWRQITATLAKQADGTMRLRLFLDGVLAGEQTAPPASFSKVPGAFTAGATNGAFPMQANGISMWARALPVDEVATSVSIAPTPSDAGLVIAWYLTDGAGTSVRNVAIEGFPFVSEIQNLASPAWSPCGVFATGWATNRDYGVSGGTTPLLGGWHHLAASYRTAYALQLAGTDYADCGNDASLDFGTTLSIESWFTPDRNNVVQTLVSKPGNYELGLNYTGKVMVTVPTTLASAGTVTLQSNQSIPAGAPCYAVATVTTGTNKAAATQEQASPSYYLRIRLYVNGQLAGSFDQNYTDPISVATSTDRLNLGRSSAGAAYFTGQLSSVRLWNTELDAATVATTWTSHLVPDANGLVSAWRWSESQGKLAYDDNNLNNAVLTSNQLWRLYAPASVLTLTVDGTNQINGAVVRPDAVGGYGVPQFTVAANRTGDSTMTNNFQGHLNEVRIWREARTTEQIREDMYRELTGAETGLAGYWPFDAGSGATAADATGHGNDGALYPASDLPTWVASRAPISNEAKEVYNVLGGLITDFTARIEGIPSVVEYPDTRRDAYGVLYSVMKRCYAASIDATVSLLPGFTVGDLDTTYAGQVQTDPSLIGFIEGAPPIPSENQTNPWWNDVNYLNTYADNTKVTVTQAQSTTQVFTGSENTGSSISIEGKVGLYLSTSAGVSVGIGEEVDWEVATAEGKLGYAGDSSTSRNTETELSFGYGKNTTTTDEISAGGEWERADHILNPEVGRRYVPENLGYAVVKSLTADLYLVTLRGSNAVVKMTLVPDAAIGADVNVINFPIDPHYTKNGTLDGMVGFTPDPDFPYADVQPSSYFQPIQAYNLKQRIERQDKQLEAYYQQFDTAGLSHGIALGAQIDAASMDTGFTKFRDQILPADPAYDWKQGLAKRSLVNTYVWTAGGGLHTEQSELVDTYSESYSGLSGWDMSNGVNFELAAAMVVGLYGEFDALFGGSVEVMSIRDKDSESGFGLDVDFEPDRYLKRPLLDAEGQPVGYTEDDAPGKVSGYRFMSFFLPPSQDNFTAFNQNVIDKNWLANSGDPSAAALRTATVQANGAWRVLHRVTYVSRVPPQLQPTTTDTTAPPVVAPANLASNVIITNLVEQQINAPLPSPAQIGAAVTAVLGTSPSEPGLLAHQLTWWVTFLTAAQDQRSDAHRTLTDLRTDLLAYMIQKYATQTATAGGAELVRLRSS